ncbi:MAG: tetratricopeptide repeat protein, partial [Microcoleaceae cyanobacterium]
TDAKKLIEINPDQPAGYKLLASIYRRQNQVDLAIQSWKKAAELYLKLADKENCRFCLEQIKALSVKPFQNQVSGQNIPNQPNIPNTQPLITVEKYLLGILRKFDRGDRTGAIFDLNWLLKADPQDGQAYCYRGILQNKQGDNWAALQDLTRALQLNSHNVIAYRYRGTVRSQLGDLAGAIADLDTAINLQPEQPSLYVNRGNIYREAGNIELGFADYQKAIALNPDEGFAYYNRAIFYARLEEINRAIADYQTAIRIFAEQGAWQNYQKALESLQKIQPNSSISHNSAKTQTNTINQVYEKLRQKLFRLVGGQWEIAESLISQCKYLFPGRSEQWYLEKVIGDIEK